jgi:hypothetical protein
MLRRIFRPKKEEETRERRKLNNEEFTDKQTTQSVAY